jgi:hypothetical protein
MDLTDEEQSAVYEDSGEGCRDTISIWVLESS